MRPFLMLAPAVVVPVGYALVVVGVLHDLAALWTFLSGVLGLGLAIAFLRRGDVPLAGVVVALAVLLACRFSLAESTLIGIGLAAGWRLARAPELVRAALAGLGLYACTGLVLMLALAPEWPLGHRNHHALVVAVVCAWQLGRLRETPRRPADVALAVALTACLLVLAFVFERGQSVLALGIVSVLAVGSGLRARSRGALGGSHWWLAAIGIVLLAGVGWLVLQVDGWKPIDPRLRLWNVALAGWQASPLFGLGDWAMHEAAALDDWARLRFWGGPDWRSEPGHAHALPLQLLVQGGVVGLGAMAAALTWVALRALRVGRAPGAVWALAVYLGIAGVSAAAASEAGLVLGGLLVGFLGALGGPWPSRPAAVAWLERASAGTRRGVSAMLAGVVAFAAVARPVMSDLYFRGALELRPETLSQVIWSDTSYASVVNHHNAELLRERRFAEAHDFQRELMRRFGLRRLSHVNAARTATFAGRWRAAAAHCVDHLRWDPLARFDECLSILSQLAAGAEGRLYVEAQIDTLEPLAGRAARIHLGWERGDADLARRLVARAELDLSDLAYLVASAQGFADADRSLSIRCLLRARDAVDDRVHLPARIQALQNPAARIRSRGSGRSSPPGTAP